MPNFAITNHVNVNLNNIMSMKILAVIEEELFSLFDVPVGINSNPVIAIHHEDLHLAVRFVAVVGEPDLASHPDEGNSMKKRHI